MKEEAELALSQAESALIKSLLESNIVGLAITDAQGTLTNCNDAFLKMLDYTREDWSNGDLRWDKINPPDYRQFDEWITRDIQMTGRSSSWEKEFFRKDGSRIAALVTVAPLEEPADNLLYFVLGYIINDEIVRALREGENRFQMMAENATAMITRYLCDGTCVYVSPSCRVLLGYEPEELLGRSVYEFLSTGDAEDRRAPHPTVMVLPASRTVSHRVRTRSGDTVWLETTVQALRDPQTAVVLQIQAVSHDITSRKNAEEQLRESEEKFRQLADSISDVFWLATPGLTRILYVSPAYEKVWGLTCQSLYDDPSSFWMSIHPDDLPSVNSRIATLPLGNREAEFRVVRRDGETRWLRVRTFPIRNEDGEVYRIAGITRDITERKKSELMQSLLSSIVEWSQDAIIGFGSDGRIFSWNAAAEHLLGYTAEEVLGKDAEFVWALKKDNLPKLIDDAIRTGEPIANFETDLINAQARPVQVSVSISPIRGRDGESNGASTIIRDISEIKKSEERLREQMALLDNVQEAISLRDLKGRVLYWNKGAERIYGWQAHEVLGQNTRRRLYREEYLPRFDAARLEFLKYGKWSGDLPQRTRDGRDITVACRWVLVRNAEGEPQSILVINTDVTTKKKLEEKFIERQRVESIGALAAGIAHDLNDVLYPVTLAIESLKQKVVDEESQYLLALLKLNAERGVALIDRILSFAKGKTTTAISLAPSLYEIVDILKLTTPDTITLEVQVADDLWTIQGDETQLKQVIINLCVNAIDAMPEGGRLQIEAANVELAAPADESGKKAGKYVQLMVLDTGVGIPEEIQERIFTPFFTTKKPGEGTGLGLSTTLSIIDNCQGYIEVSSAVNKGTKIVVYLPATS